MFKKLRLLFFIFIFSSAAFSQNDSAMTVPVKLENYFRFTYDNDFFSATDRYYTQGILLDFIHPAIKYSPFSYTLIRLNKQARNYYGLHAEQDVFTPKSIRYMGGAIYYGERPFTAIFFVSHALTSLDPEKKIALKTQLDLGIIGPYAKGEEEQKGIHKALDNIEPLGWENQLAQDVIINYRAMIEKSFVSTTYFELMGSATARLGTLYTDAGIGLNVRVGLFSPYFNSLGLEKNPTRRKFKIYAHTRFTARAIGYNATLQGGLINTNSVYTLSGSDISRVVANISGGIVVAYKHVSLEYSRAYTTPEFKKGVDHGWGGIALTVCF
jgi:lipid A 3-O-deacylase